MSELLETLGAEEAEREASAATDNAAVAVALNRSRARRGGKRDEAADAFLAAQQALIGDQRRHLHEQLRTLGLDRWSKRLRLGLQALIMLVGVVVVGAVAAMAWQAARADGVVIEAFSVPPDLAARGYSGQTLASRLEDRLDDLQRATSSSRPAATYSDDWGHEIKVEIPATGVSIGELQRLLRGWLGHESKVGGDLVHTAAGLSLTVRTKDGSATVTGAEGDLEALLQKAAEAIYSRTQPYRYAIYVSETQNFAAARPLLLALTRNPSTEERVWAWNGLANMTATTQEANVFLRRAIAEDPARARYYGGLAINERRLGHLAMSLALDEQMLRLRPETAGFDNGQNQARGFIAEGAGDYAGALQAFAAQQSRGPAGGPRENAPLLMARQAINAHDLGLARRLLPLGADDAHVAPPGYLAGGNITPANAMIARAVGNWPEAVRQTDLLEAFLRQADENTFPPRSKVQLLTYLAPIKAEALARMGRIAEAQALVATTPTDCYACVEAHGLVAALAGQPADADRWYAEAVRQGPAVPVAYEQWGRAKLDRGDLAGALSLFRQAEARGPKFADPLEGEGEALLRQGDAAGAAARLEAAAKLTPKWGRLRLKWGEALAREGRAADARAQFALAATLDLTPAERAELAAQRA